MEQLMHVHSYLGVRKGHTFRLGERGVTGENQCTQRKNMHKDHR